MLLHQSRNKGVEERLGKDGCEIKFFEYIC